ncbi:5-oxoprolinase subunit PxpA [Gillisia sp. Hel_I_29]|uniref:5-oxoprolinase subunit PxpA n=1 Tax=Gillisia sp. Hel_I_29 TaxID=1249975 RepID=UPI0005524219|nr:5-oxoprolinase subunit PxpA [Gillisia sp. Hel_I_29]
MKTIHINCDLGEGGKFDAQLMSLISACNIACGGHAGDQNLMLQTIRMAMKNQVEIGAHPSYPDKENFGRKILNISNSDLKKSICSQVLSLMKIAKNEGAKISHFKPHGALYNEAAKDENIAQIVVDSILKLDESLILYAPQNSIIADLAKTKVEVFFEAFVDRNYNPDYSLVSREKSNALITKKEEVFKHVFSMFSASKIRCENGEEITSFADTFCLHSDTENSVNIMRYLKEKFQKNEIEIRRYEQ